MNRKQKRTLKNIIISIILMIIISVIFKIIDSRMEKLPNYAVRLIKTSAYLVPYLIVGLKVLKKAGRNILNGRVFDENFLMTLATIGAFALGEYTEAAAVMIFYQIGELFENIAVNKSRTAITSLVKLRPDYANIEKDLLNEKENTKVLLAEKDAQIEFYKDLKTKMSTKMVGETLEQHCEIQFNQLRATAFRNAYFEKDNDARTGSKGDFIFRENDEYGNEIVSIMFEMKNESDTTATKHKNEDFFKELDKDRREKNCEYAVLVTLLEADSELYNAGIVDVSYKYDKMYVVRPQCFIPIITLLRNAALNALAYKQELAIVRNQDIDISNFEDSLLRFKSDFSRNYELAHNHFDKAIEEIDKTIQHLEKVKKELLGSDSQLRIATGKVEDVSIKKLTKDNPTMKEKFEQARKERQGI